MTLGTRLAGSTVLLFAAACSQPVPSPETAVPAIAASAIEYHRGTSEARCAVVASDAPVLPKEFAPQWLSPAAPRHVLPDSEQRRLTSQFKTALSFSARMPKAGELKAAQNCRHGNSTIGIGKIWISTEFAFVDSTLICGFECASGRLSALAWNGREWVVVGVANSWIT